MKLNLNPIVVTGVANSPWVPIDTRSSPTEVGIQVILSATATYTIVATMDDPFAAAGITHTFTPTLTPALGGSASGSYTITGQFLTAFQVQVSASTGTVTIQSWQTESTQGA